MLTSRTRDHRTADAPNMCRQMMLYTKVWVTRPSRQATNSDHMISTDHKHQSHYSSHVITLIPINCTKHEHTIQTDTHTHAPYMSLPAFPTIPACRPYCSSNLQYTRILQEHTFAFHYTRLSNRLVSLGNCHNHILCSLCYYTWVHTVFSQRREAGYH